MQQALGNDQLANVILQIVLNNSDGLTGSTILTNLATVIGSSFGVEGCLVISQDTGTDSFPLKEVGSWSSSSGLLTESVTEQLSRLSIHQDLIESSVIEIASPLFKTINGLIQDILPNQSWLGITTRFQERINGLVLLFKSPTFSWTQDEYKLLTQNLNAIAITIAQAQFQQQSHTKYRYQTLLKNLSREISQGYQLELLLQNCLMEIGQALQLDRSLILMFKYRHPLRARNRNRDLVKGTAKISYQWSVDQESASGGLSSFSLNDSDLCQQAWRNAPNCLHLTSEAAFPDLTLDTIATRGSALLMIPLMGKKTSETDTAMVLGFLVLQSDVPRNWSEDELELVNWIGVQMSTTIIHEQTLNSVQLIVKERTAQLKSSMDMQGKLSTKMRQHIKQLQQLNQLKDDFMNSMSHELKTPLTSMKIAIQMLRQTEISPEMRGKYLDILEQEWNREYNLIKDLLTLQQAESGELSYCPEELNLDQTLANLQQSFGTIWKQERDLNLVCVISPPKLKIHTDAESLEFILHELLLNAGKYCDAHTTVKLSVSHQFVDNQAEIAIAVTNLGAGISAEELPHIFDKFRRGQGVTDRAVPGTGLGLTLVQYLVEHLNGKIEVSSNPLDDDEATFLTTFVLKLPQIQPVIG